MFKRLNTFLTNDLAIDLGTTNTLIYAKNKGILLQEPSIVAIQNHSNNIECKEIIAVGSNAKKMLGRTPMNINTIRPLKDGVIADFHATEKMLQLFIKKIYKEKLFKPNPKVLICVPEKATQVERRAIKESILGAGAREVSLISAPIAAALGAGLVINTPTGSMVVDIGGGTTEIAILSLNGIAYATSLRIGGDKFDESIINYVRRNYGTLIGDVTAETIKKQLGNAFIQTNLNELEVRGRNLATGVPRSIVLNAKEISDAFQEPLIAIITAIKSALELSPPELAADIAKNGIVLTGGGAMLQDLDKLISTELGLPVILAKDPLTCVVCGAGKILEMLETTQANLVAVE